MKFGLVRVNDDQVKEANFSIILTETSTKKEDDLMKSAARWDEKEALMINPIEREREIIPKRTTEKILAKIATAEIR